MTEQPYPGGGYSAGKKGRANNPKAILRGGKVHGNDWIDKLDKVLTNEGVSDYNAKREAELDDSTTVSDVPGSPTHRSNKPTSEHGTREGTKSGKKAALQQSKDKTDKSVLKMVEKIGKALTGQERKMHKEVENLLAMQEKEAKRLRKENDHLKEIANITQQNSLINEQRFSDEIHALESQLDSAVVARLIDTEKVNSLRLTNKQIQDEIANMRGVAETQAEIEKQNLIRAFTKQIEMKALELEDERRNGQNTTGEWIAKNKELQDQLDDMLDKVEQKHDANKLLVEKNKVLRVEYKAQEDDFDLLQQEIELARKRNIALKDRIHELEAQITDLQKNIHHEKGGERSDLDEAVVATTMQEAKTANLTDKEKFSKYEDALQKMQKLSNTEKDSLRNVRDQHLRELNNRTELEVLIRNAINDVKGMIVHQQIQTGEWTKSTKDGVNQISLSEFTTADRRRVIEVVLSKERVLELLYKEETKFRDAMAAEWDESMMDGAVPVSPPADDRGEVSSASSKPYMEMYKSFSDSP